MALQAVNIAGTGNNNAIIILLTILSGLWLFLFTDIYYVSKLSVILFVIISLRFIDLLGKTIPIEEVIVLLMVLQLLVAPIITYNYLGEDAFYQMQIEEELYVDFVFLGTVLFIIGLYLRINSKKINAAEIINVLKENSKNNSKVGVILMLIGFSSMLVQSFVPGTLALLFHLLASARFIGFYYVFFSGNKNKLLWLLAVYGSFVYNIIGGGLFIDLFIWGMFLLIIVSFKYQLNFFMKLALFIAGFFMVYFIQTFKSEYRDVTWKDERSAKYAELNDNEKKSKQGIFLEMAAEKAENTDDFYSHSNLDRTISRLNQGWIFSYVLENVPKNEPFNGGALLVEDIRAAIVPRILDPDKKTVGGEEGRQKFMKFTGRYLQKGTSMTIGTFGDAYVNFGYIGGLVFMFCFGVFLKLILNYMYSLSRKKYPSLLLWIPFIFLYTMRAGNDLYMILNHILKSSFVVFLVFVAYKKYFIFYKNE